MPKTSSPIRIGTAGWPLPATEREFFPPGTSLLERYAQVFNAVEINSSFYRSHRPQTYRRWAETVPDDFAFAAKLPREITHVRKLADTGPLIEAFAAETSGLGEKLQAILIQLPPGLRFDVTVVRSFLRMVRDHFRIPLLCEPRHSIWFTDQASDTLAEYDIARIVADPPPVQAVRRPGGARHTAYFRLHGSPRMYYSPYERSALEDYARALLEARATACHVWCIFDNTAAFHATPNARQLLNIVDNAAVKSAEELHSTL